MFHLIFTVIVFGTKKCNGQLGFGGNGYCSTCALSNNGLTSRGFGFGGGNYDLTSQGLYSLPTSNAFNMQSNSYGYGSNGYGYDGTQTYGSPSAGGMTWNNVYGSTGRYGIGNGYINCYNNNCIPNTGYNTFPSVSARTSDYGISGNNALYTYYSSLPDTSNKFYSLPPVYSGHSNLGSSPNTGDSNSGLETTYSLPATYNSYPTIHGNYNSQGSVISPNNLHYFSSYQQSRKTAVANDASKMEKPSSSSTLISS